MGFKNTEVQPELFGTVRKDRGQKKFGPRWFTGNGNTEITIPGDTLIVIIIAVVMANLLVYVFGIEYGKRLAQLPHKRVPEHISLPARPIQVAKQHPAETATDTVLPPSVPAAQESREVPVDEQTDDAIYAGYVVQLITYKKDTTAQREVARLNAAGMKSFYLKKGNYYVVYAGKFSTKELAAATLQTLRKEYHDCFIKFQTQES